MFERGPGDFVSAREVLDTAPDAILVVGADARIVYANRQTEPLFGHSPSELLGQPLGSLIPERFRAAHVGHLARFFESPTIRSIGSRVELFGAHRDGREIPIEVSLSPIEGVGGTFVSAAIRDVSDRRLHSEELRRARIAAEAGSAAKSEFLASMSHELRTPLNAILGFAQLSQRDKKDPLSERHLKRLAQILKGGEHLLRLIDDILDLARIEAGGVAIATTPVDSRQIIDEVVATLEPTAARAGLRVDVVRPALSIPPVSADRMRLTQILMNYGSNAIKYNRKDGRVTFEILQPSPDLVRISVRDTGLGVPPDKQHTLFLPFQRAGQEGGAIEGTGIGLVISKRLAELMGGAVGFRCLPIEGSEFWVELPVHAVAEGAETFRAPVAGALPHGTAARGLVLYVEDNAANVVFMTDLLDAFDDIELVVAGTAEVGIELALARPPQVIIMDLNLPGMSGVDALRTLRSMPATAPIPVIALTAAASARDRERGEQAGFTRYLTKPVQVDELESVLEELLAPAPERR